MGTMLDDASRRLRAFDERRQSLSADLAPDCSVFRLTGLDELLVSRLIAWLLSPDGTHAQGARFLHAFCDRFHVPRPPHSRLRVELETRTDLITRIRRRIDICVLDDAWSLGVENKPVAGFQERQLADYLDHLRRRSPTQAALVVLKGWEGDLPPDQMREPGMPEALADGTLVNADYADVQLWLADCAMLAEAPYVVGLVDDLRNALQRWLSGGMEMERQHVAVGDILENAAHRDAALELLASSDHLLGSLSDRFVGDISRELAATGFAILPSQPPVRVDLPRKQYLDIELDADVPFKFSFAFDKGNLRMPYFGLRPRRDGSAKGKAFARLRAELTRVGAPSQASYLEWWFWWTYAGGGHTRFETDDTVAVWKALGDGSLAKYVSETVSELHAQLRQVGALDWTSFAQPARP